MQITFSRSDGSKGEPLVLQIPRNPLIESEFLVGRAEDCDVHLLEPFVSRHHCGIVVDTQTQFLRVRDMGSRNGTFINDQRIVGICDLHDGDKLTVGFIPLTIRISQDGSLWDNAADRCQALRTAKPRPFRFPSDKRPYRHDRQD